MSEEICLTCKIGKLVNVRKEANVEIKEFSCGHKMVSVLETVKINSELRLKLKGPKGKRKRIREIISRKLGSFERRTIKERGKLKEETGVIMIDWKKRKLSHIHCKICGNEWRDDEKEDIATKFDIQRMPKGIFQITCRKCGRKIRSG